MILLPMELNPYARYLNGQDPIPVLTTTAERLQALQEAIAAFEELFP